MSVRLSRIVCFFASVLLLTACGQWWQVRPYPDFVLAEIQPGDQLRIHTAGGETLKMTVTGVRDDRITGDTGTVLLSEIRQLEKQGKSPPANPCSPNVPLGCSVPDWAAMLHGSQSRYRDFFYPSCEQHDYCYRHGYATYGWGKEACDARFLEDMQAQCEPDSLGDALLSLGDDFATCGAVAMEFYLAVQKYGASRYRSANSSYCEYDGPPP